MKREINKIENKNNIKKVVEQHKPHSKQVNASAVNHEVRYAPHADLLLRRKTHSISKETNLSLNKTLTFKRIYNRLFST